MRLSSNSIISFSRKSIEYPNPVKTEHARKHTVYPHCHIINLTPDRMWLNKNKKMCDDQNPRKTAPYRNHCKALIYWYATNRVNIATFSRYSHCRCISLPHIREYSVLSHRADCVIFFRTVVHKILLDSTYNMLLLLRLLP